MAIYKDLDLEGKTIKLASSEGVAYIKLGLIGDQTLSRYGGLPYGIIPLLGGFFIIDDLNELRLILHSLVDKACDANETLRRELNEAKE